MSLISTENVIKYQLPNGLTVLLERMPHAPVISFNVGVKVGSSLEKPEEAGLSHVLEHMVFKGTTSYGPGEIATKVEACGGDLNAFTSLDQTVYYINLDSRHALEGLKLIREMVFEAIIDKTELERESVVILEELKRGQDSPHSLLHESLFGLAYQKHPYGRPVIGYEETIRSFTPEIVKKFYKHWYAPNNMILGVCGHFDVDEMKKMIEKDWGHYPAQKIQKPSLTLEPLPLKSRLLKKQAPIVGNYAAISFPIPDLNHVDVPALDLMSRLLGDGQTSKLYQSLKEKKKLVTSIHSSAFTPAESGVFVVESLIPDNNVQKWLPSVYEEIEKFKQELPRIEDVERNFNTIKSSLFYEKETCEGTARKWMILETSGVDFRYEEKYMEGLEKVTPREIRRVAQKYLDFSKSSTVLLHGTGAKKANFVLPKISKPTNKGASSNWKLIKEKEDIQVFRLPSGITLITKENHRLPLMSLKLASSGGMRWENAKNNGLTHLTTSLLTKGTKTRSSLEIAEMEENIAGHVDGFMGRNSWGISGGFLASKINQGVDLFCDILLNPAFKNEELSEAYEVLSNPEKRKKYDMFGNADFEGFPGGGFPGGGRGPQWRKSSYSGPGGPGGAIGVF